MRGRSFGHGPQVGKRDRYPILKGRNESDFEYGRGGCIKKSRTGGGKPENTAPTHWGGESGKKERAVYALPDRPAHGQKGGGDVAL